MTNNENKDKKLSSPPFHYSTIPVVQSTVYTLPEAKPSAVFITRPSPSVVYFHTNKVAVL